MIKSLISSATVILLIMAGGCNNVKNNPEEKNADALYRESVGLLRVYIDSAAHASDSASIENVADHYRDGIDAVNFRYPPDTYLHLSEGQNDTLTILTDRLLSTLQQKRRSLLQGDTVAPETLPAK